MESDEESARRFRTTVMPYLDDAYNLARYLTRSAPEADDIVQDASLRAFKFFKTFRGDDARPWFLAIVRNCFYSSLKAKRRANTTSLGEFDPEDFDAAVSDFWTAPPVDPERALIDIDNADAVRALIERLPVQFREALVLREMEEMSYQEIADIMDVPIGTVMSRLARARQLFKAAWIEHHDEESRS